MIDEKTRLTARAILTDYLLKRKMRRTPERFAILDKILEMSKHFGVDDLYIAIDADGYRVSRATIFNTLILLTDCGLIVRHKFGAQAAMYERTSGTTGHLHLICQQCGKVKEVKDQMLIDTVTDRNFGSFHATTATLYVYGVCGACLRRSRRKAQKAISKKS